MPHFLLCFLAKLEGGVRDLPSKTWQSCTKQIMGQLNNTFSHSSKYELPNIATGVAVIETDF